MSELKIGNCLLINNVILAPMAGVSDLPFRLLCSKMGAGMVCMEMISAKAIMYNNRNTEPLLAIHPDEGCVSLQLFGSDPQIMAEQAVRIQDRDFDMYDINMGCPVPKVVNNGEGSALMKNPKLVGEIVSAMVKAVDKPVTVKIRKGFDDDHVNAVEIAKIAEDAGAAAITVHGRTRQQYYSGTADWDVIADVVNAVSIPVIGNGDVVDGKSAKRLIEHTGCAGIAIGRAAQGNPFIFREVSAFLQDGTVVEAPTAQEKMDIIREHATLMIEYKGEYTAVREMRKHLSWYSAGVPGSAKMRGIINEMETMEDIMNVATKLFAIT